MKNNSNNHKQFAAYLRDSGGTEQDLSLSQQEAEIRAWCDQNGFLLTRIFRDEARPGSSVVARDGFLRMIEYFRAGDCQETGIILWKFSRFARDIDDAQFYKADLRRRGFEILSMKDTIPDGLDGKFFEAAIDWMNQRFLQDLSSDVKRGIHHMVETYGALPGTPPRGFKREPVHIGTRRDGSQHVVCKWIPDEEWSGRCRQAWEMRARGASYREIREATGLYKSLNSYSTFFKNRLYLGELVYGDLTIHNYAPPLISRETWNAVQKINEQRAHLNNPNNPDHPRRKNSHFILSGLAFCPLCGSPLNGKVISFKGKRTYEYYECSQAQRRGDCPARKIPRQTLETAVLESFRDFILKPENLAELQAELLRDQQAQETEQSADRRELETRLSGVRTRLSNLVRLLEEGSPPRSVLARIQDLEKQETSLCAEIASLSQPAQRPIPNLSRAEIEQLAGYLNHYLQDEDPKIQRTVLRGITHRVTAERDGSTIRGIIYYRNPPQPPDDDAEGNLCLASSPPWRHTNIGIKLFLHEFTAKIKSTR